MIQSMTGFGRAETTAHGRKLSVEAKSLNHRNLETIIRLPGALASLESDIRKQLGAVISRGRVEIGLQLEVDTGTGAAGILRANLPLIEGYVREAEKVREAFNFQDRPTLGMALGFRDALVYEETAMESEEIRALVTETLGKALAALTAMRRKEGEALRQDLLGRIQDVLKWVDDIRRRVPVVKVEFQRKFTDRVRELMGEVPLDEPRISQEIAILVEKSDVTEELVRLESHGKQFFEMLGAREPAGRKLDFLLQEMHREINTIGSKSGDVEIARAVIEIKSELAKLREQVQNVE